MVIKKYFFFTALFLISIRSISQWNIDTLKYPTKSFNEIYYDMTTKNDTLFTGNDTVLFDFQLEKKIAIISYVRGKKMKVQAYYKNGNKFRETNYNGKNRDGVEIGWYKNGNIHSLAYLAEGKEIQAQDFFWHENGVLHTYTICNKQGKNCISRSFDEKSRLTEELIKIDSIEHGFFAKNFYVTGELFMESFYNCGRKTWTSYYKNGNIQEQGDIINTIWNRVGKWQSWYENGRIKSKMFYKETSDQKQTNNKDGTWLFWDQNGKLITTEIWKNNVLQERD